MRMAWIEDHKANDMNNIRVSSTAWVYLQLR